jgi:hypothetical protein
MWVDGGRIFVQNDHGLIKRFKNTSKWIQPAFENTRRQYNISRWNPIQYIWTHRPNLNARIVFSIGIWKALDSFNQYNQL